MKSITTQTNEAEQGAATEELWLDIVRRQVGTLNFGVVQIVVHGSRVVQIERTEKVRFANPIASTSREV
jgi:hypothetical protein